MPYIEFKNVCKSFDGQRVLKNINIAIEKGEFITLLGPSGCGKTTLLRSLAGLTGVDSGKIFLDGRDVTCAPPKERNISMIFQQYSLFPTMTVRQNINFGLKMQKVGREESRRRIEKSLAMVNLTGSENKYPSQMSGGEQQRVALARAIVTRARVLLLDEPFSAIDAKLRKALQIQIREIHNTLGMTTVFVTHDQEEAMRMSDRIYLIHGGRVEQSGTPMNLYLHPQTPFAAGFMGHYNLYHDARGEYRAVRPESIEMARRPWEEENGCLYMSGTIVRIIPQGNILRYTVSTGERRLDVDLLYDERESFHTGDAVYLKILKKNMIVYQASCLRAAKADD